MCVYIYIYISSLCPLSSGRGAEWVSAQLRQAGSKPQSRPTKKQERAPSFYGQKRFAPMELIVNAAHLALNDHSLIEMLSFLKKVDRKHVNINIGWSLVKNVNSLLTQTFTHFCWKSVDSLLTDTLAHFCWKSVNSLLTEICSHMLTVCTKNTQSCWKTVTDC